MAVKEERTVCPVCYLQEKEEEPRLENKGRLYSTPEVNCLCIRVRNKVSKLRKVNSSLLFGFAFPVSSHTMM